MNLRRRIAQLGTVLASSLCIAAGIGFASNAADAAQTTMAATEYVHVRNAAGMNGTILGVLSPAESIPVTGIKSGWYQVKYKDQTAYVYQEYLNFEGSKADGDVADGKETDMQATVNVHVRNAAGMNGKVLGVLSAGEKVQVTGKTNGWYKVKYNGNPGFVYGHYLNFIGGESESQTASGTEMIATTAVNVRSAASNSGSVIGVLDKGEKITSTGTENGWYVVNYNGKTGYVWNNFLAPGIQGADTAAAGKVLTTTANVNMRTNSSTSARVIKVVPKGAEVTVIDYENGWYRVDYDNDSGCIYGEYLK